MRFYVLFYDSISTHGRVMAWRAGSSVLSCLCVYVRYVVCLWVIVQAVADRGRGQRWERASTQRALSECCASSAQLHRFGLTFRSKHSGHYSARPVISD